MGEELYRPGEDVPRSGVYLVLHQQHRPAHEALIVSGQPFPRCRICREQVRYRVLRGAAPLDSDHDFTSAGK